jgi:tetratricopeptide (TPR) repeat protein
MKDSKKALYFIASKENPRLILDGFEILFSSQPSQILSILSKQDQTTYFSLLESNQTFAKQSLEKAENLKKKYPSVPEIDNLLTYLLTQNKKVDDAEKLIEESYKKYPYYFFAKINYADQLLRKKQHHKIEEIFPSFDLHDLYPTKHEVHYSEYRSFNVLLSHYFLVCKDKEKAIQFYKKAYFVDPAHPTIMELEKKLYPPSLVKKALIAWRSACKDLFAKR